MYIHTQRFSYIHTGISVTGGSYQLSGLNNNPSRSWNVTFNGFGRDVPLLGINGDGLEGSNPRVQVEETRAGARVDGSFTIGLAGRVTPQLSPSISAQGLKVS